jgi:hypothetical protein
VSVHRSCRARVRVALAISSAALLVALLFGSSIASAAEPTISWSGSVSMTDEHSEHLNSCGPAGWRFVTEWEMVDETVPLSEPDESGARTAVAHMVPTSAGDFTLTHSSSSCSGNSGACGYTVEWDNLHAVDSIQEPVAVQMRIYLNANRLEISPVYNSAGHDWVLRATNTVRPHPPCDPTPLVADSPFTQGYGLPRFELSPLGFPERDDRVPIHEPSPNQIVVDGPFTASGSPDTDRTLSFNGMPFGSWWTAYLTSCVSGNSCDQSEIDESSKMTESLTAVVNDLESICADGLDNDGDGAVDYPADQGCKSATDESELSTNQCDNGVDDDGDGHTDWPADSDCPSASADSERSNCSPPSEGVYVHPRFGASVPGKELFLFEPSYTFCYNGTTGLIRSAATFGDVAAGTVTRSLFKALGFELDYEPPTEPPSISGDKLSAEGGSYSFAFDSTTLFDRLGAKKAIEGKLEKALQKGLEKALKRYKLTDYRTLREIRTWEIGVTKKVLLQFDKKARTVTRLLPDSMGDNVRSWLKKKVKSRIEDIWIKVNAHLSGHGTSKAIATQVSGEIIDGFIKGLDRVFVWHFPVWEPIFSAEVDALGGHNESARGGFKNPFLAITRTN